MRLAIALAIACLLIVGCGGDDDDDAASTAPAGEVGTSEETDAPDSISIPAIDVDATLTPRSLSIGEALPSPNGPYDVAIYDFGDEPIEVAGQMVELGGTPGEGGNVVLAGQNLALQGCVGAEPPCGGVFRSLRLADDGAAVDLNWQGSLHHYQIVSICVVSTSDFGDSLYRRTADEQLTILTGAGDWNSQRGWSHVLVVIAKPAPRTAVEPCPEGTTPVRSVGS